MNFYYFIFIVYLNFSFQNIIKNGIYNIMVDSSYLYYYRRNLSLNNTFKYPNTFFRIKKNSTCFNNTFYNIEELLKKFQLGYWNNKELTFSRINNSSHLWTFISFNDSNYVIQNKDNCFIKINKYNILCENIPLNQATIFKFSKIFTEVKENENYKYLELLNKEPIDIIIKYIDLRDTNLKRIGIHQIEKDLDNEELRYSIRSILDNIPWIRKIFILMPNEKVRYFKDYNLIKDKIVYVKDKDVLGYDSSNCNAFLYRYWKLKQFGISDNIIIMDDDCFIGRKLEKKDFFYIKNGKVVPSIITSNFIKIEKKTILKYYELYEKKAKISKEEQNNDVFLYSKYLTFYFILNLFNISSEQNIYIPNFTHNAIPANLKDIKEIYDLAYGSEYKYATLDCLYRIYGYLQFQIFILSYTFLKYKRKVKNIPHKFIRINNTISSDFNVSLFCINKGEGYYSYLDFYKAKIAMDYLFPKPSPYEIDDQSKILLFYNTVYSMDKIIKINEKQLSITITKKEFLYYHMNFILIIFLIFIKLYHNNNYYEILL